MVAHTPAARLSSVSKAFGATLALDDVSFSVPRGEVTVLLGASGSGKSTLLRHLNGMHTPNSGSVEVLGSDVAGLQGRSLRQLRSRIGMIFQSFNLVGPMSVLENVCTGRLGRLRGPRMTLMTYPRELRAQAMAQLERVNMAAQAHQRADTLSGGQAQRVAIARALMQDPEILLADEPVASLDPRSSAQIIELLREIAGAEQGLTVVTSLHQVGPALDLADHIIGLRDGRVILDARGPDVTRAEADEIYYPEPQT